MVRARGLSDNEAHADGCGKMENHVRFVHQLSEQVLIHDRIEDVMKTIAGFKVADILDASGGKIVQNKDFLALRQQRFR